MLQQVELATCNNKFCCATMFELVGGNMTNNAFQLAMQQCCVASCGDLLLVLLHLKGKHSNVDFTPDKSIGAYGPPRFIWRKASVLGIYLIRIYCELYSVKKNVYSVKYIV